MSLYRYALNSENSQIDFDQTANERFKGLSLNEKVVYFARHFRGLVEDMNF